MAEKKTNWSCVVGLLILAISVVAMVSLLWYLSNLVMM